MYNKRKQFFSQQDYFNRLFLKVPGWGTPGGWSPAHPPPLTKSSSRSLHPAGGEKALSSFIGTIYAKDSPVLHNAFSSDRGPQMLMCKKATVPCLLWIHTHSCSHLAKELPLAESEGKVLGCGSFLHCLQQSTLFCIPSYLSNVFPMLTSKPQKVTRTTLYLLAELFCLAKTMLTSLLF